jgi:hypothetical protein
LHCADSPSSALFEVVVADACVWVQRVPDRYWQRFAGALDAALGTVSLAGPGGVGSSMAQRIADAEAALAAEMVASDEEEEEEGSQEGSSSEEDEERSPSE